MVITQRLLAASLGMGLTALGRVRQGRIKGRMAVPGLGAAVEVIFDRWGVPHIYATDVRDLMFAQGFVHAHDRLWQMEFQRRLIAGRLAEVLGADVLPIDRWMHILGMRRVAEDEADRLSQDARIEAEAYAAGVNARIGRGALPVEFTLLRFKPEPWTPADSLSWAKMMAWSLSVNWETELLRAQLIARLGPELAAELEPSPLARCPTILPKSSPSADTGAERTNAEPDSGSPSVRDLPAADPELGRSTQELARAARRIAGVGNLNGLGSNNWVIAGSRTATGMPLLANDMHLLLSAPAIWYENHLASETLNVTGVSFPGVPGVIVGHNGHVAWGFTNGYPDVQDLYVERLRRADAGRVQYSYCDQWLDAEVRVERIAVKGAVPVTQEVIVTRHGPIINALAPGLADDPSTVLTDGQALALRWTALEPGRSIEAVRGMNRAHTCAEFREALRYWTAPVQNTVYADAQGDIGYSYPGLVPIRARGDGSVPVAGWTGEHEWIGYVPFEELPHLHNPPQGYVVSANNRVADRFPHFLGREFAVGDRAQRIVEMIDANPAVNLADIRQMHFDLTSPGLKILAGHLGQLSVGEPEAAAAVELVRGWDGRVTAGSPVPAICEIFARMMVRVLLEPRLGASSPVEAPSLVDRVLGTGPTPAIYEGSFFSQRTWEWLEMQLGSPASHWFDRAAPAGGDQEAGTAREAIMRLALRRTLADLRDRLGPPDGPEMRNWAWGRLHTLTYGHLVGRVPALARHFNRGPYSLDGHGTTVWATSDGITPEESTKVVGPPFRFIADLGDIRNSLALLAPGNSGAPSSPHYDDQIEAWFSGRYHPMLFAREDVEQGMVRQWLLQPGPGA
jgi:penicillin amidase